MLRNRKYSAGGIFLRATSSVIIKVAGLKRDPKPGHHRDDGFGNKAEAVEAAWDVLQTWNALQTAAAWRRHCCEQLMREESTLLLEVSLVLFGRGQLEVPGQVERPQQRAALEVLDAARELVVVDAHHLEQVQRLHDVVGRAFLAGMGNARKAGLAGHGKHALELVRRVALLRAVQPHCNKVLTQRQRLLQLATSMLHAASSILQPERKTGRVALERCDSLPAHYR